MKLERLRIIIQVTSLALLTVISTLISPILRAEVAVIVHPSNDTSFEDGQIKKMFLGKKKAFSNGRTAILLSLDTSLPSSDEFNSKVVGKTSSQFNAYWSKMLFTGKGNPPQAMSTPEEMVSAVAKNPDALGYVDAASVDSSVKVVAKF